MSMAEAVVIVESNDTQNKRRAPENKGKKKEEKKRSAPQFGQGLFDLGGSIKAYGERKVWLVINNHSIKDAWNKSWDRFWKSNFSLLSNLQYLKCEEGCELVNSYIKEIVNGHLEIVNAEIDRLTQLCGDMSIERLTESKAELRVSTNQQREYMKLAMACDRLVDMAVNAEIEGVIGWTESRKIIGFAKKVLTSLAGRVNSVSMEVVNAKKEKDVVIMDVLKQKISDLRAKGNLSKKEVEENKWG